MLFIFVWLCSYLLDALFSCLFSQLLYSNHPAREERADGFALSLFGNVYKVCHYLLSLALDHIGRL